MQPVSGLLFLQAGDAKRAGLAGASSVVLDLFAALNRPDLSIAALEELVKRDISLTVRVLRSINSAAYALEQPVTSVRQALVLLGVEQVRQWAAVWAMAGLAGGAPPELVTLTLLRARMCELLGRKRYRADVSGELFLLGICSTLDVILELPMDKALAALPISAQLRAALLGDKRVAGAARPGRRARTRLLHSLPDRLAKLNISDSDLSAAYLDALKWAHDLNSQTAA